MRSRTAQVEAGDGRAVARPPRHWAHEEELLEGQVAVEDVALGEPVGALEVERSQDLTSHHCPRHVGRVLGDLPQDEVAQTLALRIPVAFAQAIRHVLHEAGHHVAAGRGQARIHVRRHDAVDPELVGEASHLGLVVAPLRKIEGGHESEESAFARRRARARGAEARLFAQSQVHLGAGPGHLDRGHGLAEVRGKLGRLDEAEKRAFGIGVREHERSVDLGAVLEGHAVNGPTSRANARDRGLGANLDAPPPAGRGHGLRDRPHPAHHVPHESLYLVLAPGEQVEEQPEGGARVVRPAVLAVDVVGKDQGLDLLRFVVAVEEVTEAAGQERDHLGNLKAADAPEAARGPEQLAQAFDAAGPGIRGGLQEERLQVAGQAFQLGVDAYPRLRVLRGDPFDLRHHALALGPPGHDGPVQERHLEIGVAGHHAQAVRSEVEVADHLGPEHARDVGRRGRAAAGGDLLGDAAAAHDLAPLDHEGAEARKGEIGGRGEAVVSGTHHHGVVGAPRHPCRPSVTVGALLAERGD